MKKLYPVPFMALAYISCSIFALLSCNSNPGNTQTKLTNSLFPNSLTGEDTLNVTGDTIHVTSANNRFKLKDTCLYISVSGTLKKIDTLADKIDTLYMRKIYDSAYNKRTGTHYLTVLQMKYGLKNHVIKIYYHPLCLTRDSISKPGTSPKYGYYSNHNKFDSNYYYYTGTGFVRAPYKNQFLKDSLNYIDSILIRHRLNYSSPGHFYTTNNDTGDVHSVIYSFQEIYALIQNNSGSRYVKVSNIGQKVVVQVSGSNVNFYKHSVIMGPNSLQPGGHGTGGGSGVYYNVYADLGGLCPPTCSEFKYQLQ